MVREPVSSSIDRSIMLNTLCAPAAMRASGPFSDDRCRNAGSNSSAAARNVTKSPADNCVSRACHSATIIKIATPSAPAICVSGVDADHAICIRIANPRSLALMWRNRSFS